MNFADQNLLIAVLLVTPALILFFVATFRRKSRLLQRFGKLEIVQRLARTTSRKAQVEKAALLVAVVALILFSAARPQYGAIERPLIRKGVDIYIAIDTSLSMLAQDIKPNRLARAKEQLAGFIHRMKGDRVGIITFAGAAFVQCPLTLDYGLALQILETVDTTSVPVKGTAIGSAIREATKAFSRTEKGYKVLILLTDGEDQGTDPLGAADEAKKAGVRIYTIGIGSTEGAPIPLEDGGFKDDREGHKINSKLDLTTLQKIALATGGKAVKANPSGELELDEIYGDISQLDKKTQQSKTYTIYEDRFQYFLLPAIVLLIFEALKSERIRPKEEWRGRFE